MSDKPKAGQRNTINLKWSWEEVGLEDDTVRVRIFDEAKDKYVTKRRVLNTPEKNDPSNAAATVTYPDGFKGHGRYEVQGPDGIYHGEYEVG